MLVRFNHLFIAIHCLLNGLGWCFTEIYNLVIISRKTLLHGYT